MTPNERYEQNENLAYSILHKQFTDYATNEDFKQVALTGLWVACNGFDENRGVKFSTFAHKVIENEILKYLRDENRFNRRFIIVSADDPVGTEGEKEITLLDMLEDKSLIDVQSLELDEFILNLPSLDQTVIRMKRSGYTKKEIAKALAHSEAWVNLRLNAIKKDLQKLENLEG